MATDRFFPGEATTFTKDKDASGYNYAGPPNGKCVHKRKCLCADDNATSYIISSACLRVVYMCAKMCVLCDLRVCLRALAYNAYTSSLFTRYVACGVRGIHTHTE